MVRVPFCCQHDSDHAKRHGAAQEEAHTFLTSLPATCRSLTHGACGTADAQRWSWPRSQAARGARFHVLQEPKHKSYTRPSCHEVFAFGLELLLAPQRLGSLLHRGAVPPPCTCGLGLHVRTPLSACLLLEWKKRLQ